MIKLFSMLLMMIFLQIPSLYAGVEKKPINIAILPCTDIVMTFKKFHPLATYLTQKTGLPIRLVVPENLAKFETSINNGEIDFVLQDPHTFLKLSNFFDKDSLIRALNFDGGTTQSGVVIVKQDSGTNHISDLKGKTVMFGPKFSASKWLAARLLFEESGINIEKDLKAYFNGGCCEDIAFNVFLNAVDSGVVCDHFAGDHKDKLKNLGIDINQIVAIGKTKSVPMKVFCARKGINIEMIMKINQALLNLDRNNAEQVELLQLAELGGFHKYTEGDFASIKTMMSGNWAE